MWNIDLNRFYNYLIDEKDTDRYNTRNYLKILRIFQRHAPLPFTFDDSRQYLIFLRHKRLSPAYINHHITVINMFIRWLQIEKYPQEDFCDQLNKLRPPMDRTPDANKIISVEDVMKILAAPERNLESEQYAKIAQMGLHKEYYDRVDSMYSLLLELMYKTCARSGELCNLQKQDFNFSNHSFTLYRTKRRKSSPTGSNRVVGVPPSMESRLQEYMKDMNWKEHLFSGHTHQSDDKPISQEMCNRMVKLRAKLAGIPRRITVHMLRHSGITHKLINGAPLGVVQQMAGHKRLATTELYTHIIVQDQINCMKQYDPLERLSLNKPTWYERTEQFINSLHLEETPLLNNPNIDEYVGFVNNLLRVKLGYKAAGA